MSKAPLSIIVIGCLFAAAGIVGLAYHATEFATKPFDVEVIEVCLVRFLAVLGGAFLFRGRNWARWLLCVWLAFHVVLSFFHNLFELVMHSLLLAVIGYFLFRPQAAAFFRCADERRRTDNTETP